MLHMCPPKTPLRASKAPRCGQGAGLWDTRAKPLWRGAEEEVCWHGGRIKGREKEKKEEIEEEKRKGYYGHFPFLSIMSCFIKHFIKHNFS